MIPNAVTVNKFNWEGGMPAQVAARDIPQYATWVPDRNPAFKPHATFGQAKNAVNIRRFYAWQDGTGGFRNDMGIYELKGRDYELIIAISKGSKREDYPVLTPPPPTPQQIKRREDNERRSREAQAKVLRARADALEATEP